MSEVVGEAVLKIRTDDSDVNKGVAAAGKKGGKTYADGFKDSLKGLAGAAGLAFGADKAFDFLKDGIANATSLQDEMGALGVIIGREGTAKIEAFSKTTAKSLGIAQVAALEAAHTFSTFGKSAGLSGTGLADFSTKFVTLAGDMASFNGGSTEDAITAIGAALRGETEPIRRYGVLLDDASLRQEALRQHLIKTTKQALTPQQRVLAAQALIFKQTKDAQGDFARTSDSAANSQKRLQAQLEDVKTSLGTQLLPVVTKGAQALSDFVTGMQEGTGPGGDFVDVLHQLGDAGKAIFDLFNSLPGPVKKYGAELLIASFVVSKVSSGLTSLTSSLRTTVVGEDGVARSSVNLSGALRNLAGAGGLLLIQQGVTNTNKQLGALEVTAGAAAVGFAAGGPLGAAIAGTTAGLYELITAMKETSKVTNEAIAPADTYTASLKVGTKAITDQTRALAAKKAADSGAIESGRQLGLSSKTVVDAILGQPHALAVVAAAQKKAEQAANNLSIKYDSTGTHIVSVTDKTTKAQQANVRAAEELGQAVGRNHSVLQADIVTNNERALSLGHYNQVLKGVPKAVQTRVDQIGLDKAAADIVQLQRQYKLTPGQVRTLLQADGVTPTKRQIQSIIDKGRELDRQHASLKLSADDSEVQTALRRIRTAVSNLFSGFSTPTPSTVPHRMAGGPVRAGEPYVVGERRPELFVPDSNGVILPSVPSAPATANAGASPDAIGQAVARALVTSGAVGVTIHTTETSGQVAEALPRALATTAFLLGG